MTFERAHQFLEHFQSIMTQPHNRLYFEQSLIEANGKAIEALEKQIPVKPIKGRRSIAFPYDSDMAFCPKCGNLAVGAFYCDWCGQSLDRNKEDKK